MKNIKHILLIIFAVSLAAPAYAQTAHSSYFLEGMPTRHKLNPALASEYGYVSFPLLNDINISASSNVGVGTFLFPSESGELLNFLSSSVDSKEFLGNLKSQNKMVTNLDLSIMSFGFYKWNGFNTFDISLHTDIGMQVPKEIFEFMKVGRQLNSNITEYKIKDLNINAQSYVNIALGHSHKINDQWRVGATIKGIIGVARANMNIDQMDITMDNITNQWIINSKGSADVALKGFELDKEIETNSKGETQEVVSGADFDSGNIGVVGGGLAFDLGVAYRPIENLEITASLVDLGFVTWRHNKSMETISSGITYSGINTGNDEDIDDIGEQFSELVDFKEVDKPKRTTGLKASLNIGAEYSFLDNIISLGVLSHTRFGKERYAEGMLVANFRAKKIFMMSINGTISNMGGSFGAMLNLCPKGFNLFMGIDCFPGLKVTPGYYAPVNKFHVNASMGINFNFGKRHKHNEI